MKKLTRKQTAREQDIAISSELGTSPDIRNVVIFGESGVGKSSLINLLAGERISETSSGALGCTLEYKRHQLDIGGRAFALWDTAGLDEGSEGAVPAEKAEAYLKQLLHELAKNNGVDLLIYCVRGTRVRAALLTNYHIFYSAICRKKVPIAIVITGLENQESNMDMWWIKNESQFSLLKMYFDNHACVTTLESFIDNAILKERREVSRKVVMKMITSTCRTQRWKPQERSWVESAYSDIRAMLSSRDGYNARLPTIIMCEASRDFPDSQLTRKRAISFKNPISLTLSLNPLSFRNPVLISNDTSWSKLPFEEGNKITPHRVYHVYQVSRKHPSSDSTEEDSKRAMVVKRGADLLIFCVKLEETAETVKLQWEHFNQAYGGDLSPQIIVVIGAMDRPSAEAWWKDTAGETLTGGEVGIAYLPSNGAASIVVRSELQDLMHERCIDCGKVASAKNEKLFRRSLYLDMASLTGRLLKPENSNKEESLAPEEDTLTRAGVWEVQETSPFTASPIILSRDG